MERERRRLATILVAITGVLTTHGLAYVIAHPHAFERRAALDGHAYLSAAGMLAVPLAAVALGWASIRAARAAGAGIELDVHHLAAWQAVGFLVQEVGERAVAGDTADVLHEPAVAVGLLLQLPVAAVLVALVRAGRCVVAGRSSSRPGPQRATASRCILVPSVPSFVVVPVPLSSVARRGPPQRPLTD